MPNKKRIAGKLNGINFPCEISMDMIADLAISNLVAVFFISDDLVKLKGVISEEVYNCNGDYILFNSEGIIKNECEDGYDCPNFREKAEKTLAKIEIGDFEFITNIPHETFNVFEDAALYCVGIVFDMKDLSEPKTGIELISVERKRQVEKEGWTKKHDSKHDDQSLSLIAALYATPEPLFHIVNSNNSVKWVDPWPDFTWSPKWDKRKKHSRLKCLTIAGALIAAEIDRIQEVGKL